jgi:hypothetical protein
MLVLLMSVPTAGEPRSCADPSYRQFDFWIGEWEVRTPDGALAGTNRIARIQGGCGLQENWEGTSGTTGTSLNIYDAVLELWHQTWVDSRGSLLLLDGTFKDGRMVLRGGARPARGGTVSDRITWEATGAGTVRQLWEQSADGGKTWTVAFDGRYTRRR